MKKKEKQAIQFIKGVSPGLFGQKYSSRDYRYEDSWGKNQFNSSFPASLVAYMGSKKINPIYICTNKSNRIVHKYISSTELFGINPLSEDAYYDYEAGYYPYEQYYTASKKEKIDLVMINRKTKSPTSGLEVKLTTLPDNTTKDLQDIDYGSEIVVRSPTILFVACSICSCYDSFKGKSKLHNMLNTIGKEIKDWGEIRQVSPHYNAIKNAVLTVSSDLFNKQVPLIMQPIWKTDKAFAINGKLTNPFLKCAELEKPRISKYEIKNIILGNGQKLLRPERRFDAYLVSHPELFI